jgi:Cu+-exporting ATPase
VEGSSHRRVSGWIAWTVAAVAVPAAAFAAAAQTGTFALVGGTPQITSKLTAVPAANGTAIKITQYANGSSTPIHNYAVDMQRTIHVVTVRDDFATFEHTHPAFNTTTGAFVETLKTDPGHRYFVYVETKPQGMNDQVFRFDIGKSGVPAMGVMRPNYPPSAPTVAAGPYTVTLSATSLPTSTSETLHITVDKGGHPANDLGLYLGAPAHCVFVATQSLQFLHVHAYVHQGSGMAMAVAGPNMALDVPALAPGTYKLWIEFRGANYGLYTAPFTIAVN